MSFKRLKLNMQIKLKFKFIYYFLLNIKNFDIQLWLLWSIIWLYY